MSLHVDVLGFVVWVMEHLDPEFELVIAKGNPRSFQSRVNFAAIPLNILCFLHFASLRRSAVLSI
jgi:hypothetical protein